MNFFDEALGDVDNGLQGLNKGIPFGRGMTRLSNIMSGIQPARYDLWGAETGVGKTAIVDQLYVLGPLEFLMLHEDYPFTLEIFYNTLEITIKKKIIKWTCWRMLNKYGILVDSEYMLSKGERVLKLEHYEKFKECRDFIEKILKHIRFKEFGKPSEIHQDLITYHNANGVVEPVTVTREDGTQYVVNVYKPNKPKEIVLSITDTLGKMRMEEGVNFNKVNIDKYSNNCIYTRNLYKTSHVAIQQFNRDSSDISRRKYSEITPQLSDFKDTGSTPEDADSVIALFNPSRYEYTTYKELELRAAFNDHIRFVFLLKNRDGADNKYMPTRLFGGCGDFRELERVKEFNDNKELYIKLSDEVNGHRTTG